MGTAHYQFCDRCGLNRNGKDVTVYDGITFEPFADLERLTGDARLSRIDLCTVCRDQLRDTLAAFFREKA